MVWFVVLLIVDIIACGLAILSIYLSWDPMSRVSCTGAGIMSAKEASTEFNKAVDVAAKAKTPVDDAVFKKSAEFCSNMLDTWIISWILSIAFVASTAAFMVIVVKAISARHSRGGHMSDMGGMQEDFGGGYQ